MDHFTESEEFFNIAQAYRIADPINQENVVIKFEELKKHIKLHTERLERRNSNAITRIGELQKTERRFNTLLDEVAKLYHEVQNAEPGSESWGAKQALEKTFPLLKTA